MANLIAIPVLVILGILQTTIVNRLPLLHGTADLILLTLAAWSLQERVSSSWFWALFGGILVSFSSATPYFAPLAGYLILTLFARMLRRRVWQTPIVAMFLVTFFGTLVLHGLYIGSLLIHGTNLNLRDGLNLVTLPSLLLNILLAIPVYAVISGLSEWVYPLELEL
jgi:cell shape-determining protein MreD